MSEESFGFRCFTLWLCMDDVFVCVCVCRCVCTHVFMVSSDS